MINQSVVLPGKKLVNKDDKVMGTILEQLTPLQACDQHKGCPGPIVRFRWVDGRLRRECLYALIKHSGYKLIE
jgi:hypothetical protein